jgi:signal transduction histidine kinase
MNRRTRAKPGERLSSFLDRTTGSVPEALKKRARLTNIAALFGFVAMAATSPFDLEEATRWMFAVDLIGAAIFLAVPVLVHRGRLMPARILVVTLANLLAATNAIGLGRESGVQLLLLSLTAIPFALFDLRDRAALIYGVLLPVVGLTLSELGVLERLGAAPPGYSAGAYHVYSVGLAYAIVLFALFQVSRANARAERALRLDIAARERTERELAESRQTSISAAKMAALGEMSANVAHEVNNPLAAILLRAQRLELLSAKERLDATAVLNASRDISSTVERIRRIVDALRFFARQGDEDPMRPERVREIVQDTVELCAQRFRLGQIALEVGPVPDELSVACRGGQISQVLVNLLSNAYDAAVTSSNPQVKITVEQRDGEVRIAVSDSGPGVPAEIAGRIMEPFFTTKEIGRGTGLGLSLSKGIAEGHGGRLELDPTAPETRFVLTLKIAPPLTSENRWQEQSHDTHH